MRLQTWRGTTVVNPKPRRSFPFFRLLIAALIIGIAAYILIPTMSTVRADALVRGDLIPVTPVYRVRVDRLLVSCTDRVKAGEPVAVVSNFLIQADYQRQYLQGVEQAQVADVALEQNVATARANAESLREKYEVAVADVAREQQALGSYDQAYKLGALPQVDWQEKHAEMVGLQAEERSALAAWKRAQLFVDQVSATQTSRLSSYQELQNQAQSVAQRVGQETLNAPVTGDIVECVERPQNVIEPGTALFNIFQPDRAYLVAYFAPNAIGKVRVGQRASVDITGLQHPVTGRVAWIYPDMDALPPELTRFFWQHVQFSQYRPVKIVFDPLPEKDRQQIYYGAQARVTISTGGMRD
jgi:membrane fusion protein (multidrug efflux system)